ncbi:YqkE family protein [Sutcliffiella horikoshii]|uniref:YqkE family protein n=1 Tax=Sutcliffiella horikoshii TaxID=79883 RepID=UPI0007D09DAC|nr:YqkE family protein [Sutcliffiella horikoshii]MCM3617462.1 YqkE family protein [Sutcliffiella horikoshii]
MKKKHKRNQSPVTGKKEEKVSLKDQLEGDVFSKLKTMKDKLVQTEQRQKEQEVARIKEEKRLKEKNKSFEELFEESNQNWKEFK